MKWHFNTHDKKTERRFFIFHWYDRDMRWVDKPESAWGFSMLNFLLRHHHPLFDEEWAKIFWQKREFFLRKNFSTVFFSSVRSWRDSLWSISPSHLLLIQSIKPFSCLHTHNVEQQEDINSCYDKLTSRIDCEQSSVQFSMPTMSDDNRIDECRRWEEVRMHDMFRELHTTWSLANAITDQYRNQLCDSVSNNWDMHLRAFNYRRVFVRVSPPPL